MHLKLISCELFEREVQALAARSVNQIDIEFVPSCSSHVTPRERRRSIQHRIDRSTRSPHQAILLACGRCQKEFTGLRACAVPLVLPRVHDCLSLLFERAEPLRRGLAGQSDAAPHTAWSNTQSCTSGQSSGSDQASYWMAPVNDPAVKKPAHRPPPPMAWDRRLGFAGGTPQKSSQPKKVIGRARADSDPVRCSRRAPPPLVRRPGSLLEFLLEGYWSYDAFLVVPPGWCIGQSNGVLVAQESHS